MAGKILVAEDDPEARELLKLLLGGADYHLLEAADGVEALELLRAQQPDLLITDIVMPRMDGYELVRRLRQESALRTCRSFSARRPITSAKCARWRARSACGARCRSLSISRRCARSWRPRSPRAAPSAPESSSALQRRRTGAPERAGGVSRRLFGQPVPAQIVESTCHTARDILLAQCAQLVMVEPDGRRTCTASGLAKRSARPLARCAHVSRSSAFARGWWMCALSDVAARNRARPALTQPGDFVSMLGVPLRRWRIRMGICACSIASGCLVSRKRTWRWRARSPRRSRSRTRTRSVTRSCRRK